MIDFSNSIAGKHKTSNSLWHDEPVSTCQDSMRTVSDYFRLDEESKSGGNVSYVTSSIPPGVYIYPYH